MAIIVRDEDGIITELNIFGVNMAKVVCFKTSGLVGFGAMIPSCIGYIYWTGRTSKLIEVAFISYWGAFWPFFIGCRYNYAKKTTEIKRAMTLAEEIALKKGTAEDPRYRFDELGGDNIVASQLFESDQSSEKFNLSDNAEENLKDK